MEEFPEEDEELEVDVFELMVDLPEPIGRIYAANGMLLREVRRPCGFVWT